MAIGSPHPLIDHLLERLAARQPAILPPFHEHGDDARILADRPMPLGAHPAVGQSLRNRILRRRRLLGFVSLPQRPDIIHRMVVGDVLKGIGNTLDEVRLTDDGGQRVYFPTGGYRDALRSEEHTSELQSLMRNSYAVF